MSNEWPEVAIAKAGNRHELILSGPLISKKLESGGLDGNLFSITTLNFLQCSETCLDTVPDEISNLVNLMHLVLHTNKITKLPSSIGNLSKLKMLDVSGNKLENLPDEITLLTQLSALNLRSNSIVDIPSLVNNTKLGMLDLSSNNLEDFPDICHKELVHLSEVKLYSNKIKDIPPAINCLSALKLLDLGDNAISTVPGELAETPKLKDLNLKGNKLADRRLLKLVDQCHCKQVLDYIRQHCPRSGSESAGGKKGKKNKKDKKGDQGDVNHTADVINKLCHRLEVIHVKETTPVVKISDNVKSVRPHITCCIVRNVHFTPESLKVFIRAQTQLHESSLCDKRNIATIATHDLDLLPPGDLTYTALPPASFTIQPLAKSKALTGLQLYQHLQHEADELCKLKKRSTYSGIHKYLHLLEGKPLYPVLLNSKDEVISFPPITNSDITKLSVTTTSLFLEVTSATNQNACRKVLDTLLKDMMMLGLGDPSEKNAENCDNFHQLIVEQVRVVDLEGNRKLVYPARHDLILDSPDIMVIRE